MDQRDDGYVSDFISYSFACRRCRASLADTDTVHGLEPHRYIYVRVADINEVNLGKLLYLVSQILLSVFEFVSEFHSNRRPIQQRKHVLHQLQPLSWQSRDWCCPILLGPGFAHTKSIISTKNSIFHFFVNKSHWIYRNLILIKQWNKCSELSTNVFHLTKKLKERQRRLKKANRAKINQNKSKYEMSSLVHSWVWLSFVQHQSRLK